MYELLAPMREEVLADPLAASGPPWGLAGPPRRATARYERPPPSPNRSFVAQNGSVLAIVIWLAASGAFAFYVSRFDSYNKTWGRSCRRRRHAHLAVAERRRVAT